MKKRVCVCVCVLRWDKILEEGSSEPQDARVLECSLCAHWSHDRNHDKNSGRRSAGEKPGSELGLGAQVLEERLGLQMKGSVMKRSLITCD